MDDNIKKRFWRNVAIGLPDECWPWLPLKGKSRYGVFRISTTRQVLAHRFAYELTYHSITSAEYVCHTCDNPRCCNPQHFFLGDSKANLLDARTKQRLKVKLSQDSVNQIRELYATGEYTQEVLGKLFNVRQTTISWIINKKRWS